MDKELLLAPNSSVNAGDMFCTGNIKEKLCQSVRISIYLRTGLEKNMNVGFSTEDNCCKLKSVPKAFIIILFYKLKPPS